MADSDVSDSHCCAGLGRLVTRMANPMADPWFVLLLGVWAGPFRAYTLPTM